MSKSRVRAAGFAALAFAVALVSPLAVYAQEGQNGSAAVPALGPLGLVGLVAGIAGAGVFTMRKNRDKNRQD